LCASNRIDGKPILSAHRVAVRVKAESYASPDSSLDVVYRGSALQLRHDVGNVNRRTVAEV